MRENYGLLFFIFTLFIFYFPMVFSSLVITPSGAINGTVIHHKGASVRAFLGIPFAKPPIGSLRFKKTVPIEPWSGILQAKSFSKACFQYTKFPTSSLVHPPHLSEDCLYLNIWAPMDANMRNKKTVMFWIHGGAFIFSSSILNIFHGQVLAAEGDVIVVTFDYRVGVEGFFYSGTNDAPGNMGMWDMVEALKWVNNNIEYFGGDKDSITIFGQSAGGVSVGMLAVSPVTKGLFKRIIMESGAPTNLNGEDNNRDFDISLKLAKKVGCVTTRGADEKTSFKDPQAVVECMRKKNPYKLAILLTNVTDGEIKGFHPRFGDAFLPKNPRKVILEGDFEASDVLIGTNSGDGNLLLTKLNTAIFGYFGEKYPQINRSFGGEIIKKKLQGVRNVDPDAVVRQYLGNLPDNDYYRIRQQVLTAYGDFGRTCPSVYLAESFAKKNALVYYYFFTHRPLKSRFAPWLLATHMSEVQFVFGYPLRYPLAYSPEEIELSKRLIRIWSSFGKTGKPEGIWLPYSKESPLYHVLDTTVTDVNKIGPHRENCDFFRPTFGVDSAQNLLLEIFNPLTYFNEENFFSMQN